ncbi:GumC family protein [Mariniflexile ostreae]|uniref:non-specific protein-tyrosine kinase n=1 Tax=Mariniflexile ostreae TaxID=1520892 RepID=A0ABV5FDU0_9FLAO
MLNQNTPESTSVNTTEGFNLKQTISIYAKQWKWFVLSCLICLTYAYFNIRYTTPQYVASAKIMLLDENDGNSPNAAFKDLSLFAKSEDARIEDEIHVVKSREFLKSLVKKLGINLTFYTQGRVYESELYKKTPIHVNFLASDSIIDKTHFNFYVDVISDSKFKYKISEDGESKLVSFGEIIPTSFGEMIITPKGDYVTSYIGKSIRVNLRPVAAIAESLKNRVNIMPTRESSKVLDVSLQDAIVDKAKDIINTLIVEYNKATVDQKNIKTRNTANFINERVELIASDLVNVDDSIVRFKTGNKITDVSSDAGQFLTASAETESQLNVSKTQMHILDYMNESLGVDSGSYEPINLNVGDPSLDALSMKYNEILTQRQSLLKSAGEKNATVQELNQSLNNIRHNLKSNIENSIQSLDIRINSLENQSSRINSRIYSVPGQERKLRSIERKQGVKESIYLFLLQKREEVTISLAATSPNSKIIDEAYSTNSPVSPNGRIIYIASLFIGLLVPFGFIYVKDLLDNKIHNKEDLEKTIQMGIPVLGEIPRLKGKKESVTVQKNDRSLLSESFRIIRTNFDYVSKGRNVKDYNNVIFVTSTINGEGKSFFSINMALTLANTNKSVLLIGADIRNPKTHLDLKAKADKKRSEIGLTEYLVDKTVLVGEGINTYDINGNEIDVMLSGKVPPNPAELLMNERMKPLFDTVSEQYDYVIVDTAPSMLVTDTLLFSKYAGHTIYVTRAGYTEKRLLNFAKELQTNGKLNGMAFVVNDVDQSNFGYGARYGYYGSTDKKSWFKKKKA